MKHPGRTSRPHPLLTTLLILACWFFSALVAAQDALVQAELSSPTVAIGESVTLQIVATGIDAELDLSALEAVVDVLGQNSSRQVNIFNGTKISKVIWNIEITPRRSGQIVVPAVTVGNLVTSPLLLQVTEAPVGAARKVYVEASVDNEQPFVQSQVGYTIKVYQRVQLSDASLDHPKAPDITVQQIDEGEQSTENIDSHPYSVYTRRYVLFPQTSGRIVIPPVTLQGSTAGTRSNSTGLFTPRNRFSRQSNSIELDVQLRPASFTGQWWLPVSSLELTQKWVTPAEEYYVGRPLTRTITLTANGVGEAQLPEIIPPELTSAKIYADASEAQTISVDNGVQATRRFSWAIIPQQAGKLVLPPVTIPWFDVVSGTMQTATLPPQTIEIQAAVGEAAAITNNSASGGAALDGQIQPADPAGAADDIITTGVNSSAATDAATANGDTGFWKRVSLILGVGWVVTMLGWVANSLRRQQSKRSAAQKTKPPSSPRIPIQIAAVEAAIKDNDLAALSRSVSAWGKAACVTGLASPGEIAGQVNSAQLRALLWQLDAALYSPERAVDTAPFAQIAVLLRAEKPTPNAVYGANNQNEFALPAL
ncbi:MAG: BatD family protein [Granulosicoccaceae bacterium]